MAAKPGVRRLLVVLAAWLVAAAPALAATPTDELYGSQDGFMRTIGWDPVTALDPAYLYPAIAVVDSGLVYTHPEFEGVIGFEGVVGGVWSARCPKLGSAQPVIRESDGSVDPEKIFDKRSDQHGTRVAAIATASVNGIGAVGISPRSPLIVIRLDDFVQARPMACALNRLARYQGPLVVNVSVAHTLLGREERTALQSLVRQGALVVAATGNGGRLQRIGHPAVDLHVLAVGEDALLETRTAGNALDLLAPGKGFPKPTVGGGWDGRIERSETSWAAPVVAGAAALVWSRLPGEDNPQVIADILRTTAGSPWKAGRGFGTIDVAKAVSLARSRAYARTSEYEPNETPALARQTKTVPLACARAGCTISAQGLAGLVDDPTDCWPVARGRRVRVVRAFARDRRVPLLTSTIASRAGSSVCVRVKPATSDQGRTLRARVPYTLRVTLG